MSQDAIKRATKLAYQREYRKRNPESYRKYNRTEKHLSAVRKWRSENKRHLALYGKKRRTEKREQIKKTMKVWRKSNPEKWQGYSTRWGRQNRQRSRELKRESYRRNREARVAYIKKWQSENPQLPKLYRARRRARKNAAQGTCTPEQWMARVEFYGWKCFYCNRGLNEKTLTMDHRIALANGGSNWPSNLVPACLRCNSSKSHRKDFQKCGE